MRGCRPLSDQEVELMLRSFGGVYARRDKALFTLGIFSGFRITELLSLRLKDVYRHGRIVDRVRVERRHMKRKREPRSVILHPLAKEALLEWIEAPGATAPSPETYVFKSRKGANRPIGRIQALRILKDAFESCEMTGKLGTHSMRKTFANNVHERLDRDLVKTQHALGQMNITSTIKYLSFREEEIDDAILAL